jgi:nitroreductase
MEFSRLINERCSIRKYASGITREELEPILRQAQRAPSWKNQQTSRCYAVTSPEMLEELREAALPLGNRNHSANAALIVSTFVKDVVGVKPLGVETPSILLPPSARAVGL